MYLQNYILGVNTVLKSFKFDKGDVILCTDNTYAAIKNTCNATSELPGAKGNNVSIDTDIIYYLDSHTFLGI